MPVAEHFKSKEALLEYARTRAVNKGNTSTSQDVWGDVQAPPSSDRRAETEGDGETSSSSRRDGGFQNSAGGASRFIDQFTDRNNQPPRSGSSTYQYNQSATRGNRTGVSWGDRVKQTFKPFQKALKTTTQKKKVAGKREPLRRLTDAEAIKMLKPLVESLLWTSEHLYDSIFATTKGHQEVEIWGDLDKSECEIISEFLI